MDDGLNFDVDDEIIDDEQTDEGLEGDPQDHDTEVDGYKPSYSYKVRDKDFEFDDRVKSSIKVKEDEEYFRDLYTRAGGVDHYKERVGQVEDNYKQLYENTTVLTKGLQQMKALRDQKSYDQLFEHMGVSEDDLFQHVIAKARQKQLPQEEQARIGKMETYQREISGLKDQISEMRGSFETSAHKENVQRANQEYEHYANTTEGKKLGEVLEGLGLNLASEVSQHGLAYYAQNKKDADMVDVFNNLYNKYKSLIDTQQASPGQKTTLPNTRGRGGAPVDKGINSIEDLYKLRDQLGA